MRRLRTLISVSGKSVYTTHETLFLLSLNLWCLYISTPHLLEVEVEVVAVDGVQVRALLACDSPRRVALCTTRKNTPKP
jgi:hypothetical protein